LQLARSSPFESGLKVCSISAIAADEAMLFHEERPEVEGDFATGSRAAGDDGSTASEAIEAIDENVAPNMFHNQIDTVAIGDFANFGRPSGVCRIQNKFCAEVTSERAFGFG